MLVTELTVADLQHLAMVIAVVSVFGGFLGVMLFYVFAALIAVIGDLVANLPFVREWKRKSLRRLLDKPDFVARLSSKAYARMRYEAGYE